jgi:hypothetical protein
MAADGTTGILAVSEDAQFPRAQPPGDNLNHFQSELRASAILLFGSLPGLFLFRFAIAAGSQLWTLAFAIEADEDREGKCFNLAGKWRFSPAICRHSCQSHRNSGWETFKEPVT